MGNKKLSLIFSVAACLSIYGIYISVELTRIHYLSHTDPEFHAVCALSEGMNCETVALSPYSVFLGVPVSVWGIFGYLLMTLVLLSGVFKLRLHDEWPLGGMSLLAVVSLITSGILAYISITKIDSVCVYCVRTYIINIIMFLLMTAANLLQKRNPVTALLRDISAVFKRPLLAAALSVLLIGSLTAIETGYPVYWNTTGFKDLPTLPTGENEEGHHWIGATSPSLTIVEFSDYECPHCRKAHKKARKLAADHPDEIRLYHRHLPLDNACHPDIDRPFHRRACEFAKAAECAGRQGRFWEMNDALFSVQDTMKSNDVDIEVLAVKIGVDRSDFKACMQEPPLAKQIAADIAAARKKKINGTPTFFIGEDRFLGEIPNGVVEKRLEPKSARANP